MIDAGRRLISLLLLLVGAACATLGGAAPAAAQGLFDTPKYASIVVDANTGEVLYSLRADQQRFPASITKVMTLYLTFEALTTGRLSLDDRVPFSAHAAAQAPSKLGVPVGDSLTVRQAILGVTVKSANDAAVALAERVAGSESRFTQLMTLRAQELGMKGTNYVNANGLPDSRQVSTARDIAILARAVMRDYPQYYAFFNAGSMSWEGHVVNNPHSFLRTIRGVDGLKTGYTNAAGHNLVASAVRDGRRLITVVLGGTSNATRDENVENLFDAGFAVLRHRAAGENVTLAALMHEPDDMSGPLVRPPTEMGSAEQPQLSVVLRDPVAGLLASSHPTPSHGARLQAAAASAPDCVSVRVKGRRHRHARVETRCDVRRDAAAETRIAAVPDCDRLHGRRLRACRKEARSQAREETTRTVARAAEVAPDCDTGKGRRRHHHKACDAAPAARDVAKAELRDCAPHHGRRHAKACDADTVAAADEGAKAGGGYTIQVGAFPSRTAARQKLTKLASVVDGEAKVESGGGKGYRARFTGLSAKAARAACGRLSARGQDCLVVAPG